MARFFGLLRSLPQLLERRRGAAEAQWIEPGNDVTRAILDSAPPAMRPAVRTAVTPAPTVYVPGAPSLPAVAEAPHTRVEAPAVAQPQPVAGASTSAAEEQIERPAKRRRWHRAA